MTPSGTDPSGTDPSGTDPSGTDPSGPGSPEGRQGRTGSAADLRMVTLATAAWGAAWLGLEGGAAATVALLAGCATCLLLAARLRSPRWLALALVVAVLGSLAGLHAHRLGSGPVADLGRQHAVAEVQLEVRGDPRLSTWPGSPPRTTATVPALALRVTGRGQSWRVRTPVLVLVGEAEVAAWTTVPVGSRLTLRGRLAEPTRGGGIAAVVRADGPPRVDEPPGPGLRLVERVRQGLRSAVAGRAEEPRALVPALVLGDTSRLTPALTADFEATGLTHLTAVSGANLTLLLAFLGVAARWVGVRGRWLRLLGVLGVVVFVALCRTEPSVLRAAAMGLVALAALGTGSRASGLRNLAVAMTGLLLVDPQLSRSLGFALSVLASGGIICWARRWAGVLHRWLPLVVAESLAVPLAAHLSTAPLVAWISGSVSLSGLLANALAGPFVGPATVLGLAAAGLSLVSPALASVAGFGAAWSAQVIVWVAHAGAQLPGSSWRWPATPLGVLVLAAAALTAGLLMVRILSRPWLALLLAALMVAGLLRAPVQPGWPPRDWVLVACDIGQGDALVLRAGPRAAVLVDTGPDPPLLSRCLDSLGVTEVPLVVLSHFHADHVDGIEGVYRGRRVGEIWGSGLSSPAEQVADVAATAARQHTAVRVPPLGHTVQVGAARIEVVGPVGHRPTRPASLAQPGPAGETESSVENEASLVLRVEVSGVTVLLTGDLEPTGQQALLAAGVDLRADVLKVPHHGSARQERSFFAATGARLALASAGQDNAYGHPAPRTVALARSLGMTVLSTDEHGALAVTVRRGRLGAVTQR